MTKTLTHFPNNELYKHKFNSALSNLLIHVIAYE